MNATVCVLIIIVNYVAQVIHCITAVFLLSPQILISARCRSYVRVADSTYYLNAIVSRCGVNISCIHWHGKVGGGIYTHILRPLKTEGNLRCQFFVLRLSVLNYDVKFEILGCSLYAGMWLVCGRHPCDCRLIIDERSSAMCMQLRVVNIG